MIAVPAGSSAAVEFDRGFGVGVDTGGAGFENCTIASGCQAGIASGVAGGLDDAQGVATDAAGGILVASRAQDRVNRYTVAGDGAVVFDRAFGFGVDTGAAIFENCTTASGCQTGLNSAAAGGFASPFDVAVDAQGRILVTDQSVSRVARFMVAGDGTVSFDRAFGFGVDTGAAVFESCTTSSGCQSGIPSGAAGAMFSPTYIEVDEQGRILVGDSGINNRVNRYTVAGDGTVDFDRSFGVGVETGGAAFENCTTATGCFGGLASPIAGGFDGPTGVSVDEQGRILVGDNQNARVDRFTVAGDGTVSFDRAFGIGVDTGALSFENCTSATGCQSGNPATAIAGAVPTPQGVVVDPQGRIVVGDRGGTRVDRFVVAGDGTVSFDRAFGVNVDPSDGDTGDFENCTNASGCRAGTQSGAAGGLDQPAGVAVDEQGRILVADNANKRIQRFTSVATVRVTKSLAPASDSGRFDLRVDGTVVRAAAGNGDSGTLQVADGTNVTISEHAATAAHPLSDYDTTIDCGAGPRPGTSLALTNVASNVTCTISNARKPPTIEVTDVERDRKKGTATLTVAANAAGKLTVDQTKQVKSFGTVTLDRAGEGKVEVVLRKKAARRLERRGRVKVNPRIRFLAAGDLPAITLRHEFKLRKD